MLCSLFFSYGKCKYKERGTHYGVSFDIVAEWMLQNLLLLCYALKIPLLDALLNYGTSTMLKNGTPFSS
jgi:hypothetical protein